MSLPRLNYRVPITQGGYPVSSFHVAWQQVVDKIESLDTKTTVAAQSDSVAVTLAALVTDFNALLAKLRASGLMA